MSLVVLCACALKRHRVGECTGDRSGIPRTIRIGGIASNGGDGSARSPSSYVCKYCLPNRKELPRAQFVYWHRIAVANKIKTYSPIVPKISKLQCLLMTHPAAISKLLSFHNLGFLHNVPFAWSSQHHRIFSQNFAQLVQSLCHLRHINKLPLELFLLLPQRRTEHSIQL